MSTKTRLVTAEELLRMPDNGMCQELIAGEVHEAPPPGEEHGRCAMNFAAPLWNHVHAHDLGRVYPESGYVLSRGPDTVRAPDVAFVAKIRVPQAQQRPGYFEGAPDLVVEVLSPSDRRSAVASKVASWLAGASRMVVVVDPRGRTLIVHRTGADVLVLAESDVFDGADVVPGFRLPVARIFDD